MNDTSEECVDGEPTVWALNWTESSSPCLEHAPHLTEAAKTRAIVLGVMAVLSLIGNILTIISIRGSRLAWRRRHHTWSTVYTLIFHLSVADLLVTVFCIAGEAIWSYTVAWVAGK